MNATQQLTTHLKNYPAIGKVVNFNPDTDGLLQFDFTSSNTELSPETVAGTPAFSAWISQQLSQNNCRYGIGGYMEHRTLYARSAHFDAADEPRRLHLGVDIWAEAGTPVFVPLPAVVHSFQDNNHFGDYGPTIILTHRIGDFKFYSLYGHLSRISLAGLSVGQAVAANQQIGTFGTMAENGSWPPHLHFQLVLNMEGCTGDYPGVGKYSQREHYLQNIPDPDLILQFPQGNIIKTST